MCFNFSFLESVLNHWGKKYNMTVKLLKALTWLKYKKLGYKRYELI